MYHERIKKGMKPERIVELMKDLATEVEMNVKYEEDIDPELLEACRVDLPEKLHEVATLEKALSEYNSVKKAEIKKIQVEADALVRVIHTGKIQRTGDLYHVPDYDRGIMQICLGDGKIINELPLAIGTQTTIPAATDDDDDNPED